MIDTIYTFLAGFLLGFGIMYYIAANLLGQTRKEIRYWRKDALAAQSDATFWQNAYAKDANK